MEKSGVIVILTRINLPFCEQKSDSAACGPCCLKMVLDYYKVRDGRKKFTKHQLVQLAWTSAETGTNFGAMKHVIAEVGLSYKKLLTKVQLTCALAARNPVIALVKDPGAYFAGKTITEYHYIVLTGFRIDGSMVIYYDDPYYEPGKQVAFDTLWHMMKPDPWMLAVKNG